ncbi:MAG: hypothetical protein Q9208_005286 [Pyrenodesmia sp. 3 TL-2023]
MGQRHQLFVVARINGRYRQLGAIHHQWLYGHTALRRCLDTLKIFQDSANRSPIQQELVAASSKDDDFWLPGDESSASYNDEKNSHVPFPFIMTCLILGASFNLDGYYHGVSVEPYYMAFDEGDNNNGITIFDITDLTDVRYCFVDFYGMESEREVDLMTPLSARTYLEAYYEVDAANDEAGFLPLLESFQGRNLVTINALKETWPSGDWQGDDFVQDVEGDHPHDSSGTEPKDLAGDAPKYQVKSLRDQSMDNFLDVLLDPSQDTTALLVEAELLTDFIPRLRRRLYEQAATLTPSTTLLNLLHKALSRDVEVDLSPFNMLPVEHLSTLVEKLRHGTMRSLNLSNMTHITESDLEAILKAGHVGASTQVEETQPEPATTTMTQAPRSANITRIILLETPNISLDFVAKHLGGYDVYHSGLFRRALQLSLQLWRSYGREEPLPTLPFGGANIVSQLVWVGISSARSCDSQLRTADGHFDWSQMNYSDTVSDRFGRAEGLQYKNFLLDIPTPVGKTVQGLQRLMRYLSSADLTWAMNLPEAAARCLATTSTLGTAGESSCGLGPLSAVLHNDDGQNAPDRRGTGIGQMLQADRWAIILMYEAFDARDQDRLDEKFERLSALGNGQEGSGPLPAGTDVNKPTFKPQKRLRYALAKALPEVGSSTTRYLVTDVPGYIKHVLGDQGVQQTDRLNAWWASVSSAFYGAAGYYDDNDMDACLRMIYSDEGFGLTSKASQGTSSVEDAMERARIS